MEHQEGFRGVLIPSERVSSPEAWGKGELKIQGCAFESCPVISVSAFHASTTNLEALTMALPVSLHASTTPQELEFIAGYEMIEILPSVQTDRIRVLSVSEIIHGSIKYRRKSQSLLITGYIWST